MSLSVGTGQALEKLQPSFVIKILSNLFIESNFFNFTTSVYGDVQLTLLSGGRLSASPSCGGRGRRGCSGLRLAGGLAWWLSVASRRCDAGAERARQPGGECAAAPVCRWHYRLRGKSREASRRVLG